MSTRVSFSSQEKLLSRQRRERPLMPDVGVLAFVPDEWSELWQPRHHLLSRLARYFHVLWTNSPHGWRDVMKVAISPAAPVSPPLPCGFQIYNAEWWLPRFYRPQSLSQFTFKRRLEHARRRLLRMGCTKVVAYLWRPEFDHVLGTLQPDLSCYHVDDEYSFSDSEVPISQREKELIASVDQVFIHSPALMEKKGWVNPHSTLIYNGVDYEELARPTSEPADLCRIPHPRIGYGGWIKKTLDWPLLLDLCRQHSQWSFVFVGKNKGEPETAALIAEVANLPNVYFLGEKTTAELFGYPHYFDVCIMPYAHSDYTRYIYPMKLHEYLAAGRPVVASRLRSLEAFSEVISLAANREQWSSAIAHALTEEENTVEKAALRQKVARKHDWCLLTAKVARTICRRLREKTAATVTSFSNADL